jgi:uncharacterized sulfatase
MVWGGATDDPKQHNFSIASYPSPPDTYGIGVAPFAYWRRGLDSYTQIMSIVDEHVGNVVDAMPADVAANTVIVFCSDHGEYAGAHGFLSGKAASCYDEAWHVPLIVVDPTGRFTGDIPTVREGLTSSVDMLRMLVTLGNNGSEAWLKGQLGEIYGRRHDMTAMLKSADAPGRPYVLLATDELVPGYFNFNNAPQHIIGLRTQNAKLGTYAHWKNGTADIDTTTLETEFYDYATAAGRSELDSTPNAPRAGALLDKLLNDIIPNELRATLPGALANAQFLAMQEYLAFAKAITNLPPSQGSTGARNYGGWGADF